MKHYQPPLTFGPLALFLAKGANGDFSHAYRMPNAVFESLYHILRMAKVFSFDFSERDQDEKDAEMLGQFIADRITDGTFQTPFDVSYLEWRDVPRPEGAQMASALVITMHRRGKLTDVGFRMGADILRSEGNIPRTPIGLGTDVLVFGFAMPLDAGKPIHLQDMSLMSSYPSDIKIVARGGVEWPHEHMMTFEILKPEFWEPLTKRRVVDIVRSDGGVTIRNLLFYLGSLSSRGPRETKVEPKPAVVAKRDKEGRLPWVSYSVIRLPRPDEFTKEHRQGQKIEGRASPRVHWRRGHDRHLKSGKVVPIEPMIVGLSELGEVISSYAVG